MFNVVVKVFRRGIPRYCVTFCGDRAGGMDNAYIQGIAFGGGRFNPYA
jgi:hypothetical protein